MDEFYHKDIFGTVVDVNLREEDEDFLSPKSDSDFNLFSLTDALGARDKKRAWILYEQALLSGIPAEKVFFQLVWQVRSMLLASKTKSALEADMKPFPYSKAKGFLKNFKDGELEVLSEKLVTGHVLARRGEGEIETLIEKIILGL